MKIGIVHDYQPNLGGTTEVIIRMARALKKRGHECKLVTHPKSWIRKFDEKNIDLIFAKRVKITFMGYTPFTLTKVARIISLFKRGKIDLTHAHYALPYGISSYLAKQAYAIPYVVTLHGTDVHKLASNSALKPVMKLCLENADAVTCVCEYLKKTVMRKLNMTKEIEVIPNFVNIKRFRKKTGCAILKKQFNIPRSYFIVTHISNYASIKNTLIIPDIAKNVIKKHPKTIFLMVGAPLGENGYDLDKLKNRVIEMKLSENFRFVGRRKDIDRILNISDISIMTSLNEGLPMVILESLAVGVPVVASKVGGIPEIIKNDENGYLVKRNGIDGFVEEILKFIKNSKLKNKLGKNGINLIHKKYSEDVVISKYLELYEKIK